ncbi:hypothetical protein [Blastococcus brunescens]|uniref:Uncharacterized protein n=1 Tax=Blastococcus brunescens TaxID=1564165 RepID=A0ABZ1B6V6_9ACTN|nr:hypothetical protein [Blastococcus sp. BMG 8361]WRL66479.1 hypothetical protein U6N30_14295 [Blastococcus sp. BMG 8361]
MAGRMEGDPPPLDEGGRRDRTRHPERGARRRPRRAGGAARPARRDIGGGCAIARRGVPEADALEQQLSARPGEAGFPYRPVSDREADEADSLEQDTDVPVDDDDIGS